MEDMEKLPVSLLIQMRSLSVKDTFVKDTDVSFRDILVFTSEKSQIKRLLRSSSPTIL